MCNFNIPLTSKLDVSPIPEARRQRQLGSADHKNHLRFRLYCRRCQWFAPHLALVPWRCGVPRPLARKRARVLFYGFFHCLFRMVNPRVHPKVRKRSSPTYPCFGGASSICEGRVCYVYSEDLIGFFSVRVRWCCFISVALDQRLLSLAMVVALEHSSFRLFAQWLPICLLQQALLCQDLLDFGDGEARKAAPWTRASVCSHR
jgi:hypothetical protein